MLLAVIAGGMGSHIYELQNPPEQMTVVLKVRSTIFSAQRACERKVVKASAFAPTFQCGLRQRAHQPLAVPDRSPNILC
jgi:hypothetical protein